MNKPHKHAELIKAWADGAVIQYKDVNGWEDCVITPSWHEENLYRIKPEPKPDVIHYAKAGVMGKDGDIFFTKIPLSQLYSAHLKLTFDGETGKLKKAEVLE